MRAALTVSGQKVVLHLAGPGMQVTETFVVETERKLRVSVEDFNFDGYKDFSISHIDDGMGTYEISLLYVYAPKRRAFLPLAPRCGDEFINLKVNKSRKTLTNSYLVDNQYRTCEAAYVPSLFTRQGGARSGLPRMNWTGSLSPLLSYRFS